MSDDERPIVNIEGELVALGPLRRELIPLWTRWFNDFQVTGNLAVMARPMTFEQEEAWYERSAAGEGDVSFAIYERSTWRPIGNCGLHGADTLHRTAEVGIVIGEPDARGKGYGTEAMRLLLDYAFTVLALRNVMLRVYEYNAAARRSYEKVGFREIGRRRGSRWHNGRFWDEVYMDMLASEFESPVLRGLLEGELEPRGVDERG
jgi:RimJ/RimL family protein N-acetyltransferase